MAQRATRQQGQLARFLCFAAARYCVLQPPCQALPPLLPGLSTVPTRSLTDCTALHRQQWGCFAASSCRCGEGVQRQSRRTAVTLSEAQEQVDAINDRFVEAREEIDLAKEDAETTYFNESCTTAREAVADVLQQYNTLLDSLDVEEKGKLSRAIGLKIKQLEAELGQLDTLHE